MPTVADLLKHASTQIERGDAQWLLAHVLQRDAGWLFAHDDAVPDAQQIAAFERLVTRRAAGEPVAYLTGLRGFWTLQLQVSPATLIPRPETELLVELALARLPDDGQPRRIADLGTGSGAIALAIASERAHVQVLATDFSADALAIAQANAARLGISHVHFAHGDWFAPLAGQCFDVIVSNPPYIELGDAHLQQGDLRFEPASALSSGADGLDAIRTIIAHAGAHLHHGGWLLLEHGYNQAQAIRALLQAVGFTQIRTHQDWEQRDRVTLGQWQ